MPDRWFNEKVAFGWSQQKCAQWLKVVVKTIRNWVKDFQSMLLWRNTTLTMQYGCISQLKPEVYF